MAKEKAQKKLDTKKATRLVLAIYISVLCGCHNVPMWKYDIFEKPIGNEKYPPLYVNGWQDGCESGADASANHLYKFRYKFKQDWLLIADPVYRSGWEHSYNFCRKYVLQHNLRRYAQGG